MQSLVRSLASRLLVAGLCLPLSAWAPWLAAQTSVRQVKLVGSRDAVEIEVEASDRIVPQTQLLTAPDRLVVDFPNAVPGKELFSQSVNRGQVKDLRVGLFQSKPPITRIVLDLLTAQSYQVFPYGRTIMIKVGPPPGGAAITADASASQPAPRPGFITANYTTGATRIQPVPARPPLEVTFRDGLLTIRSNQATLSEVLHAVQQRTGADIAIPAGAEQEKVAAELGPALAQEVLANLLNGSKFNFLILNSATDPRQLDRVILSPRGDPSTMPLPPVESNDAAVDVAAANAPQPEPVPPRPVRPIPTDTRPDTPPPTDEPPQQ